MSYLLYHVELTGIGAERGRMIYLSDQHLVALSAFEGEPGSYLWITSSGDTHYVKLTDHQVRQLLAVHRVITPGPNVEPCVRPHEPLRKRKRKPIHRPHLKVVQFVGLYLDQNRDATREDVLNAWNSQYPRWAYPSHTRLFQDYRMFQHQMQKEEESAPNGSDR